jgi:putative transposase
MNRGVNKQQIFTDDRDRFYFMKRIAEYKEDCDAKVYHWALMENHYHMLIEITFDELRPFMSRIQQRYAQYHHSRHGTSGTFWQGRFRSKPVALGPYLVSCGRYIERNPVRACIVDDAAAYQWSSARCYVSGAGDRITDANPYLGEMTATDRQMYAEALASGIDDEIIAKTRAHRGIGDEAFSRSLKIEKGRCRRKQGRPEGWLRTS